MIINVAVQQMNGFYSSYCSCQEMIAANRCHQNGWLLSKSNDLYQLASQVFIMLANVSFWLTLMYANYTGGNGMGMKGLTLDQQWGQYQ